MELHEGAKTLECDSMGFRTYTSSFTDQHQETAKRMKNDAYPTSTVMATGDFNEPPYSGITTSFPKNSSDLVYYFLCTSVLLGMCEFVVIIVAQLIDTLDTKTVPICRRLELLKVELEE
ncbi:unnamed protein product [Vicia faba]|uniref:Uncharacterized protein n=1 Tax=Vicia faba TaxID=3906 RepID=A0AAV1BC83_VICFA|nr:unnamed protein product [Vicia faba]